MKAIAYLLACTAFLMILFFLLRPKVPKGMMLLFPKLIAMALSPYWAVVGVVGAVIGWLFNAVWAVPMGGIAAVVMIIYVLRNTRHHDGFEKAFGENWMNEISPEQLNLMVQKRWSWVLSFKDPPEPAVERDLPFRKIPGTDREVLCDIWRPCGDNISGLAYIYLHGSGWAAGDKDFGTRFFFRHLASQGHTVMDVAYRLIPETDIHGMLGDAKHAVAWLKANAAKYKINPKKIVLGGGSAGGHIALLAGYTPGHPELTPAELKDTDTAVCGLVTYYPTVDLLAGFKKYNLPEDPPSIPLGTRVDPKKAFENAGRLDILLGGFPDEKPDMYQLANPMTHVNKDTPPTLILQGSIDLLIPINDSRALSLQLQECGVPNVKVIFPWTEHIFDLILPKFSPPAQAALYDVDRFMALLLNKEIQQEKA